MGLARPGHRTHYDSDRGSSVLQEMRWDLLGDVDILSPNFTSLP